MTSEHGTAQPRTTLAIVDDFAILVESLDAWVQRHAPDVEVVACASTFRDLVASRGFPSMVTLIGETRHEPTTVESRITACVAAGSQVVIVADNRAVDHHRARQAGAAETLQRTAPIQEIMEAVRRARRGRTADARKLQPLQRPSFSQGERTALTFYTQGHSTREVATAMGVKYETAKTFLRRVRQKYAAVDRLAGQRAELIVRAHEDGLM